MSFRLAALLIAASLSLASTVGVGVSTAAASNPTLYRATWMSSASAAGWQSGGGKWTVANSVVTNTGNDASSYLAPFKLTRADYAVQARIRLVAWRHSGYSEDNVFGILFRGGPQGSADPATGLVGGVARGFLGCDGIFSWAGIATADTDAEVLKETFKFRPEYGWHTYRAEVRGNTMRLLVDGHVRNTVTSKRLATQRAIGLYALAARIQVADFTVIGL